mmetsp:Transcript_132868/g.235089  ORF Transcript_132868/g.235089 Transcript_132868/m.235089 type:complete len:221 (+) Transcript_132868:755-1417(+)
MPACSMPGLFRVRRTPSSPVVQLPLVLRLYLALQLPHGHAVSQLLPVLLLRLLRYLPPPSLRLSLILPAPLPSVHPALARPPQMPQLPVVFQLLVVPQLPLAPRLLWVLWLPLVLRPAAFASVAVGSAAAGASAGFGAATASVASTAMGASSAPTACTCSRSQSSRCKRAPKKARRQLPQTLMLNQAVSGTFFVPCCAGAGLLAIQPPAFDFPSGRSLLV